MGAVSNTEKSCARRQNRHSEEQSHRRCRTVARKEGLDPEKLCERIAAGSAVIMQRSKRYTGIGKGLSTKVNVNLGTSSTKVCLDDEIQKAKIAETFGADTISDLSMGGDINAIRKEIFSHTTLPITTVPVYQAVVENGLKQMTADDIMATLRMQAGQGISSVVIHGVSREMLGGTPQEKTAPWDGLQRRLDHQRVHAYEPVRKPVYRAFR